VFSQKKNQDNYYFEVKVDGERVLHVKNDNPRTFENVKVYAGDKYHQNANAEIRTFEACQTSAQGNDCMCGIYNTRRKRSFNGVETRPNKYPWVLKFVDNSGSCGASLITDRHVITNAHCTRSRSVSEMRIVLGLHNNCHTINDCQNKGENIVTISKIVEHPDWLEFRQDRDFNKEIDIAILTLSNPVSFSNKIRPICLPVSKELYHGSAAVLAGWGKIGPNRHPDKLMEARMTISSTCSGHHPTQTRHICFRNDNPYRVGCSGDSGSPVFLKENERYTQIGVNFGTYNGRCDDSERSESAGVRVSGVIEWIRQHAAGTFDSKCNKF